MDLRADRQAAADRPPQGFSTLQSLKKKGVIDALRPHLCSAAPSHRHGHNVSSRQQPESTADEPLSDLQIAVDAFVGVMFAEVIVKPIAVRTGRAIVKRLDLWVDFIPDFLWGEHHE